MRPNFYGLALGWIRHISGGLLFPIVAHIVADAAILTLVLVMIWLTLSSPPSGRWSSNGDRMYFRPGPGVVDDCRE
jgi:hypothetical protein